MTDFLPSLLPHLLPQAASFAAHASVLAQALLPALVVVAALLALSLVKSFAGFAVGLLFLLRDAALLVFRYPGASAVLVLVTAVTTALR